jgi:ubiquitin-conjugating enzyme E2 O
VHGCAEGIYVRAFEDRMDALRVLIVGAADTPYADVLFTFDVGLPVQYPTQPPLVYFYSLTDGLGRLNPNLYEDGRVCLSLLNTWMGDGVEVWTPRSTLLQLLVSLQALVLVRFPYYNEAGFERHRGTGEGHANALVYNERAFLLSMRVRARCTQADAWRCGG